MQTLFQDLRFGFRMLRRSPGFSVLAFLCLTLGIGSNAAVFSWIEGILIRPYPLVPHQDRMFALVGKTRGVEGHNGLYFPDFVDFSKNCMSLSSVTRSAFECRRRCRRHSTRPVTNWKTAGRVGSKATHFSNLALRVSRRRPS